MLTNIHTALMRSVPAKRSRADATRHVVAAIAYDKLSPFEFGIAVELFGLPRPEFSNWYEFVVCAADEGPLKTIGGLEVKASSGLATLRRAHTIIVPGWRKLEERPPAALVEALKAAHRRGARLVSFCSGVFVLAATGLLDGRRATTHWRSIAALRRQYPRIIIDPDVLYVDEGNLLTSAGSAAGIDLSLHIIRRDHGTRIANAVARRLVMAPHREGGQAQYVPTPVGDEDRPWLARLFEWAQRHIDEPLSVERLAREACMSTRTLTRRFADTAGVSPTDWIIGLRVARAKDLLETTTRSVEQIATSCGFGSAATLRHHFRQRVHMSPARYRARVRLSSNGRVA